MDYTIKRNPEFNSLEITFTSKAAKTAFCVVDKLTLRAEFSKVWDHSEKMIDYCTNAAALAFELPNNDIVVIEKQRIKTSFCFGESGYDFDEAAEMAAHARTSQSYFKHENMARFNQWLESLKECKKRDGNYILTIRPEYREETRIKAIHVERLCEVLEDLGGSAHLDELPGKEITEAGSGLKYRIATAAELDIIEAAYKDAAAKHEKKVDAYLKRYGTSKVNSWTYWRDA